MYLFIYNTDLVYNGTSNTLFQIIECLRKGSGKLFGASIISDAKERQCAVKHIRNQLSSFIF